MQPYPFAPTSVDVVICARDEARTITAVVRVWRLAALGAVIVVDDGSTDGTGQVAGHAGASVVAGPGVGKGEAMAEGLRHVRTRRVAFSDGDLAGLSVGHVRALCVPYIGQTVGLRDNGSRLLSAAVPPISGERCLPTAVALSADLRGWGAELALDAAVAEAGLPTRRVVLRGARNPSRGGALVAARIAPYALRHAAGLAAFSAAGVQTPGAEVLLEAW